MAMKEEITTRHTIYCIVRREPDMPLLGLSNLLRQPCLARVQHRTRRQRHSVAGVILRPRQGDRAEDAGTAWYLFMGLLLSSDFLCIQKLIQRLILHNDAVLVVLAATYCVGTSLPASRGTLTRLSSCGKPRPFGKEQLHNFQLI